LASRPLSDSISPSPGTRRTAPASSRLILPANASGFAWNRATIIWLWDTDEGRRRLATPQSVSLERTWYSPVAVAAGPSADAELPPLATGSASAAGAGDAGRWMVWSGRATGATAGWLTRGAVSRTN